MPAQLDIIISIVLVGMVILMVFVMQVSMNETRNETIILSQLQSKISIMKDILKQEIKNIGTGLSVKEDLFSITNGDEIAFSLDANGNGLGDNVHFFTRAYSTDPTPKNPNDFEIVKQLTLDDGSTSEEVLSMAGITDLKFKYFDKNMNVAVNNSDIRFVEIFLEIESSEKINNNNFLKTQIKETLFLRNIYKF